MANAVQIARGAALDLLDGAKAVIGQSKATQDNDVVR
jgi:hypothetical protein